MKKLFAAAILGNAMALSAIADTVVWYDFDALGDAGTSVSKETTVVNKANPGTLDATVYSIRHGAAALDADSSHMPAAAGGYPYSYRIYDPISGAVATSADGAIKFTTPAEVSGDATTKEGGAVQVQETSSGELSTGSFTLELTIRLDPDAGFVKSAAQTLVCKSISASDNAPAWELRWFNSAICFTYYDTDGQEHNIWGIGDIADGEWHHLAYVVTSGASWPLKRYLDYTDKGVDSFAPRSGTGPLTIGAQFSGATGTFSNPSRGVSIGEFRWSNSALSPAQFLKKHGPGTGTLSYVTFDDGTANASSAYSSLCAGSFWAGSGSVVPGFSDEVPGAVIRDGQGGPILTKSNEKSISFNGITPQCAIYGKGLSKPLDTYFLHKQLDGTPRTSGTIEFWMKSSESQTDWYGPIRFMQDSSNVAWQFIFVSGKLYFMANGSTTLVGDGLLDGKWHHVAATFKPNETDSSKTDVITYVGGNLANTKTVDGQIKFSYDEMTMQLGLGYKGLIDELRISDCALEPSQFLRAENAPGLIIIFK